MARGTHPPLPIAAYLDTAPAAGQDARHTGGGATFPDVSLATVPIFRRGIPGKTELVF